jgi:hypothetical protein
VEKNAADRGDAHHGSGMIQMNFTSGYFLTLDENKAGIGRERLLT